MDGWKSIASAPLDEDVQLWVQDYFGARALPYPCRLTVDGWTNTELNLRLATSIKPEYWRAWPSATNRPLPDEDPTSSPA